MASSRPFTLYKIRHKIAGKLVTSFEDALAQEALSKPTLSAYDLTTPQDFEAKLFVDSPEPTEPGWLDLLREGFGHVPIEKSAANSAVLMVRLTRNKHLELFALTYGFGRFLLRSDGYERSFGLRFALNTLYEADNPTAIEAPVRVRRVDAKTVAANTMLSRHQANRLASFDEFGLDIQRDLLGAVTGVPADKSKWGTRVGGADALHLNLPLRFAKLGRLCSDVLSTHSKKDYQVRFSWVDNIHAVTDPDLIARLEKQVVVALKTRQTGRFELAPPELIEWDDVASFRFSVDPTIPYDQLDLESYLQALDSSGHLEDLDIQDLRTAHRIAAVDATGDTINRWSLFQCLDGEIRPDRQSVYLLVGGDFFEVAPNYLRDLDRYIQQQLAESSISLPASLLSEKEGPYNERAAQSSSSYLMLDRQVVRVDTSTSPIEICDLLTSDGCFVHVKRKLSSSSLSHLFAQGTVSADLLLMSREYREKTIEAIEKAAQSKGVRSDPFMTFDVDSVTPSRHEIVYGIIESWNGRSLTEALPFFSKVNLRRHSEDLRRMGYRVSYRKIDVAAPPTRSATKRRRRGARAGIPQSVSPSRP